MRTLFISFCIFFTTLTQALSAEVVSVELDRQIDGKPVAISALVQMAEKPNGKAILLFPGWPGIPRIEENNGTPSFLYLQEHFEEMAPILHAAGITTVTVDCPTDQWGARGYSPTACDDGYRSSALHAKDVAALISKLKLSKPIQQITIMGHSYGAVSSHWLSLRLNSGEIHSAIHSASQSVAGGGAFTKFGASMARFNHAEVQVPYVYLHHEEDLCNVTPYSYAYRHSKKGQLITVVGGNKWSAPCGKASYHGYSGRRPQLADALVAFINRAEVTAVVKGDND